MLIRKKQMKTKTKTNGALNTILGRKLDFNALKASGVVKVLYEKNHTKFTLLDNNRDIDIKHVATLMSSMKKHGQLMPIIVNEDLEVIEGQHRLKACTELDIPVAYIISIKASGRDIAVLNNSQKGWKNRDYLKHYNHKSYSNHKEYMKVSNFFDTYSLPFHTGLMLLSGITFKNRGNDRGPMPSFRDGTFKVKNLEKANIIAGQLEKFKAFVPRLVRVNKFCLAFTKISTLDNFSIKICYEQIEKNHKKFDGCGNQQSWDEGFESAYNYKLSKKKKISLRKEGF